MSQVAQVAQVAQVVQVQPAMMSPQQDLVATEAMSPMSPMSPTTATTEAMESTAAMTPSISSPRNLSRRSAFAPRFSLRHARTAKSANMTSQASISSFATHKQSNTQRAQSSMEINTSSMEIDTKQIEKNTSNDTLKNSPASPATKKQRYQKYQYKRLKQLRDQIRRDQQQKEQQKQQQQKQQQQEQLGQQTGQQNQRQGRQPQKLSRRQSKRGGSATRPTPFQFLKQRLTCGEEFQELQPFHCGSHHHHPHHRSRSRSSQRLQRSRFRSFGGSPDRGGRMAQMAGMASPTRDNPHNTNNLNNPTRSGNANNAINGRGTGKSLANDGQQQPRITIAKNSNSPTQKMKRRKKKRRQQHPHHPQHPQHTISIQHINPNIGMNSAADGRTANKRTNDAIDRSNRALSQKANGSNFSNYSNHIGGAIKDDKANKEEPTAAKETSAMADLLITAQTAWREDGNKNGDAVNAANTAAATNTDTNTNITAATKANNNNDNHNDNETEEEDPSYQSQSSYSQFSEVHNYNYNKYNYSTAGEIYEPLANPNCLDGAMDHMMDQLGMQEEEDDILGDYDYSIHGDYGDRGDYGDHETLGDTFHYEEECEECERYVGCDDCGCIGSGCHGVDLYEMNLCEGHRRNAHRDKRGVLRGLSRIQRRRSERRSENRSERRRNHHGRRGYGSDPPPHQQPNEGKGRSLSWRRRSWGRNRGKDRQQQQRAREEQWKGRTIEVREKSSFKKASSRETKEAEGANTKTIRFDVSEMPKWGPTNSSDSAEEDDDAKMNEQGGCFFPSVVAPSLFSTPRKERGAPNIPNTSNTPNTPVTPSTARSSVPSTPETPFTPSTPSTAPSILKKTPSPNSVTSFPPLYPLHTTMSMEDVKGNVKGIMERASGLLSCVGDRFIDESMEDETNESGYGHENGNDLLLDGTSRLAKSTRSTRPMRTTRHSFHDKGVTNNARVPTVSIVSEDNIGLMDGESSRTSHATPLEKMSRSGGKDIWDEFADVLFETKNGQSLGKNGTRGVPMGDGTIVGVDGRNDGPRRDIWDDFADTLFLSDGKGTEKETESESEPQLWEDKDDVTTYSM